MNPVAASYVAADAPGCPGAVLSVTPRHSAVRPAVARPTVLHFTPGIGGGGAEAMLTNLVSAMQAGAWRNVVVAMDARSWPAEAAQMRSMADAFYDLQAPAYLKPAVLRKLHEIIRAESPSVVQTWMHHADFVGGLSARLAGVRHVVWSIHCREVTSSPGDSALKMKVLRAALAVTSRIVPRRIVSCSSVAIEDHAAMGYPRSKMCWIPNGICTKTFAPRPEDSAAVRKEFGVSPDAPLVGFAGRFHEMKRLDIFLNAAAVLKQRVPSTRFVLLGGCEADLTPEARAALGAMPGRESVIFAPRRRDMDRFYSALTLFSLSSRTEAFPMTLLEAMACGVPCASTDVGDSALIIGDRTFAAPAGDAAALAAVWEKIISLDASARAALSASLRGRIVSEFTIDQSTRRYAALYDQLLDG